MNKANFREYSYKKQLQIAKIKTKKLQISPNSSAMLNLLSLFLFLFVSFAAYSQTDNYLPGYVIMQTGDSIAGKILYKGNDSYNNVCIFREEGSNKDKRFTTNDIQLYRYFDTKCYVPLDVPIDNKIHTVFVEYLLNGIISIYYYGYLNKYYVKSETGELLSLSSEERERHDDKGHYVYKLEKYIGILKYVFRKDDKTLETLDKGNITLNQRDLISLGRNYHNAICTEWECVVYEKDYDSAKKQEKDIRRKNLSVGFWGGVNSSFIPFNEKFIKEPERYVASIEKNNSVNSYNPYLGVFINYRLFFIHPNLNFKYELDYSQQTNKRHIKYASGKEDYIDRRYDIEITLKKKIIDNTFYLKYNFLKMPDYNLYIQGGYSFMYLPYNIYQRQGQYEYGRTSITTTMDISTPEINLKKFIDNGVSLGFGYQRIYKNIRLNGEIKYKTIFGNTVENSSYITSEKYNRVPYTAHNLALTVGVELYLSAK